MVEGERHWFIFAGSNPAVLIKDEINDIETLQYNCRIYAKQHKAAIWAIAASEVTGILAWPKPIDNEVPG